MDPAEAAVTFASLVQNHHLLTVMNEPPAKRRRMDNTLQVLTDQGKTICIDPPEVLPPASKPTQGQPVQPIRPVVPSLVRPISPPPRRKLVIKSPFQLTQIRDLPASENVATLTLQDLLGDPLIEECWEFNYLHDIPFLMNKFHETRRSAVKVHVIHGFWKQEDPNKAALDVSMSRADGMFCPSGLGLLTYVAGGGISV
jgi:hypothetical protein